MVPENIEKNMYLRRRQEKLDFYPGIGSQKQGEIAIWEKNPGGGSVEYHQIMPSLMSFLFI